MIIVGRRHPLAGTVRVFIEGQHLLEFCLLIDTEEKKVVRYARRDGSLKLFEFDVDKVITDPADPESLGEGGPQDMSPAALAKFEKTAREVSPAYREALLGSYPDLAIDSRHYGTIDS